MTSAARARIGVAVLVAALLVLQAALGADLRVGGVTPDLLLVLAIAAGRCGGARQGAVVGFAAGLLADLYATGTPVGLGALAWCLVGYGVGALSEGLLPESRVLTPVVAFGATVVGVGVFLVLGELVGQSQLLLVGRNRLVGTAVGEGIWSAALTLPITWAYARVARGTAGVEAVSGRADLTAVR